MGFKDYQFIIHEIGLVRCSIKNTSTPSSRDGVKRRMRNHSMMASAVSRPLDHFTILWLSISAIVNSNRPDSSYSRDYDGEGKICRDDIFAPLLRPSPLSDGWLGSGMGKKGENRVSRRDFQGTYGQCTMYSTASSSLSRGSSMHSGHAAFGKLKVHGDDLIRGWIQGHQANMVKLKEKLIKIFYGMKEDNLIKI